MGKFLFGVLLLLCSLVTQAQPAADTLPGQDSLAVPLPDSTAADSLSLGPVVIDSFLSNTRRTTIRVGDPSWRSDTARLAANPFFRFKDPARYTVSVRQREGKEAIFYSIIGLLLLFALIKNGFYRYIQDLYKTFFRTTLRQRQIKEQLLQSPLPSLLLNAFFVLSIGMFLALLLQYFRMATQVPFWLLYLYSVLALVAVYGVKFVVLKFIGWILQAGEVLDTYIFVVFTTNKVMGISILPFLIVMAFSYGIISQAALNLGIGLVAALFVYRYFLSYVSIHRMVRISFFHFMLYFCAFEIAPLLLINKLLVRFLS